VKDATEKLRRARSDIQDLKAGTRRNHYAPQPKPRDRGLATLQESTMNRSPGTETSPTPEIAKTRPTGQGTHRHSASDQRISHDTRLFVWNRTAPLPELWSNNNLHSTTLFRALGVAPAQRQRGVALPRLQSSEERPLVRISTFTCRTGVKWTAQIFDPGRGSSIHLSIACGSGYY